MDLRVQSGITMRIMASLLLIAASLVAQTGHKTVEVVDTPPKTDLQVPADAVPAHWEFRTVHSDKEVTSAVADGWQFVSMGSDSNYLLKRWTGKTMPILRSKVEPHYTRYAYQRGIEGDVLLSLVVGADGIPKNVSVERSLDDGL